MRAHIALGAIHVPFYGTETRRLSGAAKEDALADPAQITDLVEKMNDEREKLLGVLEAMTEEQASTPHKEGEWNQKQQMAHLCEMETAYRAWVERALEEDGANVDGVRGDRPAIRLEDANEHTLMEHLAEMRRQRDLTMAMIAGMEPEEYDRRATNSLFGSLTALQWLRSYYRHDRMHYDQVRGEEPTYKPQFKSGAEPDQRRGPRIGA
jgi:hypothetical protein